MRYKIKIQEGNYGEGLGNVVIIDDDPWDETDYPNKVMCLPTNAEAAKLIVKALNEHEYGEYD